MTKLPPVDCPFNDVTCIVGTGFLVNESGDIITANHVAMSVSKVIAQLAAQNVKAEADLDFLYPNFDNGRIKIAWVGFLEEFTTRTQDPTHDIAVLSPTANPFESQMHIFRGPPDAPGFNLTVARLDIDRPRDGADVFACGFPMNARAATTTSGKIATAWGKERLSTSPGEESEVYELDMRINPGNSGGPVFRTGDQAVIGMVDAVKNYGGMNSSGAIPVIIPARYIADLLNTHGIAWHSAHVKQR